MPRASQCLGVRVACTYAFGRAQDTVHVCITWESLFLCAERSQGSRQVGMGIRAKIRYRVPALAFAGDI